MRVLYPLLQLQFGEVGFVPGKTSEQDENSTHTWHLAGIDLDGGGAGALSSLRHPFSLCLIHNHVNFGNQLFKTASTAWFSSPL